LGSLTFSQVFVSSPQWGGCGPKGITCYGNGRHVAVFEETGDPTQPQRLIYSADDGVTWVEGTAYESTNSLWFGPAISPETDRVLVGNSGPNVPSDPPGEDAGVALSTDATLSWSSGLEDDLNPLADTWDCDMLVYGAGGRVLAGGWFNIGPNYYNLLTSDDGGATWPTRLGMTDGEMDPRHLVCGAHCGNGVIFVGSDTAVYDIGGWIAGHPIWRSTDNGDSWERTQLVSTDFAEDESNRFGLTHIAHLGGSAVAACSEGYDGDGNSLPLVWLSTDLGDTWSELSGNLSPVWGDPTVIHWPKILDGFNAGQQIVLCISRQGATVPAAVFSEDFGSTWTEAVVPELPSGQVETELMWSFNTRADDGAMLATLARPTTESGADVYPNAYVTLGAVSGHAVTLQATSAVWPDPYAAINQHIKFTAGGEVVIVGWYSSSQVWVNFVTSPATVGPFAPGAWYIHPANRQYWEIWRGVGSWDMGVGWCYVTPAPTRRVKKAGVPPRGRVFGCSQECANLIVT
jgi:hypothetical protein